MLMLLWFFSVPPAILSESKGRPRSDSAVDYAAFYYTFPRPAENPEEKKD